MKRFQVIVLLLILSFVSIFGYVPDTLKNSSDPCKGSRELSYKHPYLTEADSLFNQGVRDQAYELYETAADKFEKEENWEGLVKARNMVAWKYLGLRELDTGIAILRNNLELIKEKLGPDFKEEARALSLLGVSYDIDGKIELSLDAHSQALNLNQKLYGKYHMDVAKNYIDIGTMYKFANQPSNAEKYLFKAAEIIEHIGCDVSLEAANNYYNLALTYRLQDDLEKAIIFGEKALAIFNSIETSSLIYRTNALEILGSVAHDLKDYDKSLRYKRRAINELQNQTNLTVSGRRQLADYMSGIGPVYTKIEKYDSAYFYLNRALTIYLQSNVDSFRVSSVYLNLGINYTHLSQFDSAFYYLSRCLAIRKRLLGSKDSDMSHCLRYMGNLYLETDNLDSALYYYHKAVIAGTTKDFKDNDEYSSPNTNSLITSDGHLIRALWKKGHCLLQIYLLTQDQKNLESAMNCFELGFDILDLNQKLYEQEGSTLFMTRDFYGIFDEALEVSFQLYLLTNDPKHFEQAFQIMEKSKARILLETFNQLRNRKQIGVPDSAIQHENELKYRLASFKRQLASETQKVTPDHNILKELQEKIFLNTSDQDDYKRSIAQTYPAYYESKASKLLEFRDIQKKLSEENSTLISYFWGDSVLYSIILGHDSKGFYKMSVDSVETLLRDFLGHLLRGPQFLNRNQQLLEFTKTAHSLSQILLQDIKRYDGQKLIIAADGLLRFIPFEALIMEKPVINATSYEALRYAIHYFPISYVYSANLWAIEDSPKTTELQALGFSHSGMSEDRKESEELPGTADEIEVLKNLLKGLYFSGSEATKQHFIDHAQNYDIIHLAIHGISDSTSHHNNRLLFRSSKENGIEPMFSHELYKLRLNSRLVVLSACESGIGKNYQGEGVYSMSRAFSYAGCPTTVMSLWRISDKTTPVILEQFYRHISKGKDVDHALRAAKLNYLKEHSGNMAHPSQWAAMVVHGSTDGLTNPFPITLLIAITILVIFGIVAYRNRMTITKH